jgi:hypothetical protein
MMRAPTRYFTLSLVKNCPEARAALAQWQEGNWTFEQAMMEVVKQLYLAKGTLQQQYDYIPPGIRAAHQPPRY